MRHTPPTPHTTPQPAIRRAKFGIGDVVHHQLFGFYGVVIDVDVKCMKGQDWLNATPAKIRPKENQPFYYIWSHPATEKSTGIAYEAEIYLENGRTHTDLSTITARDNMMLHAPSANDVNDFLKTVMN